MPGVRALAVDEAVVLVEPQRGCRHAGPRRDLADRERLSRGSVLASSHLTSTMVEVLPYGRDDCNRDDASRRGQRLDELASRRDAHGQGRRPSHLPGAHRRRRPCRRPRLPARGLRPDPGRAERRPAHVRMAQLEVPRHRWCVRAGRGGRDRSTGRRRRDRRHPGVDHAPRSRGGARPARSSACAAASPRTTRARSRATSCGSCRPAPTRAS